MWAKCHHLFFFTFSKQTHWCQAWGNVRCLVIPPQWILEVFSNLNFHSREWADPLSAATILGDSHKYEMLGVVLVPWLQDNYPRIKADIPDFFGTLHIKDFLDWISEVEKYFELMNTSEEGQVRYNPWSSRVLHWLGGIIRLVDIAKRNNKSYH